MGAQAMEQEDAKDIATPDLEEKLSDQTSARSPKHSIEHPSKPSVPETDDTETAQSETAQPLVKVPPAKRRGLFGRFTLLAEVEEPKHYPQVTKWFITFVVALAGVAAPMGSAIIFRKSTHAPG